MNPDNTKPLADRRTAVRQAARNEHAYARRINKAARHREPIASLREIMAWTGGHSERQPTGPGDAHLRAFEGRPRRNRPGRQSHDAYYRKG